MMPCHFVHYTMYPEINASTEVYGILGHPLSHSLSPLLHNAAFAFYKQNAAYIPLPIQKVHADTGKLLLDMGIRGLSVTIPHKKWAAKRAQLKDPLTHYSGAANTLKAVDGKWHAYNTDGPGALKAIGRYLGTLEGSNCLIIGYGGAALAIAHSLLLDAKPAGLWIAGRNNKKIHAFRKNLINKHPHYSARIFAADYRAMQAEDIQLIIQTTPLGMEGFSEDWPLPKNFIKKKHWVFDIVYKPMQTKLLCHALRMGAGVIPGYLMLLYQASLQIEIFSQKKIDSSLFAKLEEKLRSALSQTTA